MCYLGEGGGRSGRCYVTNLSGISENIYFVKNVKKLPQHGERERCLQECYVIFRGVTTNCYEVLQGRGASYILSEKNVT